MKPKINLKGNRPIGGVAHTIKRDSRIARKRSRLERRQRSRKRVRDRRDFLCFGTLMLFS